MILNELTGVKKHKNIDFRELLAKFENAGGTIMGKGRFSYVISHSSWNYVFKIFPHDDVYLKFVNWAGNNPHPCVPIFYGRPKRLEDPFWDGEPVWIVKQEKLLPSKGLVSILDLFDNLDNLFKVIRNPEREQLPFYRNWQPKIDKVEAVWKKKPEVKQFMEFVNDILVPAFEDYDHFLDAHKNNVMVRPGKKTLVFVDPLWSPDINLASPFDFNDD